MRQIKYLRWMLVIIFLASQHLKRTLSLVLGHPPLCNSQCVYEYVPVCGSDGRTYPNVCFLYVASCRDLNLTYKRPGPCVVPDPCHIPCNRRYEPVCGSDGVTYTNPCVLMYYSCLSIGQGLTRAYAGRCRNTSSGGDEDNTLGPSPPRARPPENNIPMSPEDDIPKCPIFCTREYLPVCGNNGVTYGNRCTFNMAACNDPSLTIVKEEECDESMEDGDISFRPSSGSSSGGSSSRPSLGSNPFNPFGISGGGSSSRPTAGSNPFNSFGASGGGNSSRPTIGSNPPDSSRGSSSSGSSGSNTFFSSGTSGGGGSSSSGSSGSNPFFTSGTAGGSSSSRPSAPQRCPLGCSQENNTVCGSDGITYTNECTFNSVACRDTRLSIVSRGPCDESLVPSSNTRCPLSCNEVYEPVCGSDDVTYPNLCYFNQVACVDSSVTKVKDEPCSNGSPFFNPSTSNQRPPSTFNQRPPSSDQRPSTTFNQRPPSTSNQRPPSTSNQRPPSTFNQRPPSTSDQRPSTTFNQRPPSSSPPPQQRPPFFSQRPQSPGTSQQRPPSTNQQSPSFPSTSGDTSDRDFCLKDCPFTYSPLCGTDKVTYTNKCTFDVAVCKDASLRVDYVGRCI